MRQPRRPSWLWRLTTVLSVLGTLLAVGTGPAGAAQTFTATRDAYVLEEQPTTNGNSNPLVVRNPETTNLVRQALLTFNTTTVSVPAGQRIKDATLRLQVRSDACNLSPCQLLVNETDWVAATNGGETSVVWNTRPAVGAQVGSSNRTVSTTYASISITLPAGAVNAGGNTDLYLLASEGSLTNVQDRTSASPPQLVVNFEPIPAKPKVGHWRNRPADGGSWRDKLNAAEAQFGAFQGHWRNFHPAGSPPLAAVEEQALADGKRLFLNWKPYPAGQTWKYTADGSYNATLDSVADDLKAQAPREIWLTIGHEPENDLNEAVVGWRSVDYRNMWAQVRARFNARGVANVKWVMTYMGFENHRPIMDDLWPGDGLVDIVAQDPYINKSAPAAELGQKMVERLVWLRDNEATNRHWGPQSKPQVFPEWGCDLGGAAADRGTDQHRADCINGVKNRLLELGQLNLIELDFFDAGSNWLTSTGVDQAAYRSLKTVTET